MSQEPGRRYVFAVILLILVPELFLAGSFIARAGLTRSVSQVIRLSLEVILCYALLRGRRWARIVVAALLGIACAFFATFLYGSGFGRLHVVSAQVLSVLLVIDACAFALLVFPAAVSSYFARSRTWPVAG